MNMSVNRAVAIAAAADPTELRSSYERAVSHGAANTLCTPEEESESPSGTVPSTANTYGGLPPEAERAKEYDWPV